MKVTDDFLDIQKRQVGQLGNQGARSFSFSMHFRLMHYWKEKVCVALVTYACLFERRYIMQLNMSGYIGVINKSVIHLAFTNTLHVVTIL